MSFGNQITALRNKRVKHLDAMSAMSILAEGEDRLFTDDESTDFEKDRKQVEDIDVQLVRLEDAERRLASSARPAPAPFMPQQDIKAPAFKTFPGQALTRVIGAMMLSRGNLMQAAEIAKRWENETPEVLSFLRASIEQGSSSSWIERAAVAAGTTTNATWAAPLIEYRRMNDEFIELLRPATILGRLTGYVTVPFNCKIPRVTAGVTANWVGEGLSKPVGAMAFDDITVPWAKVAIIVAITMELARFSTPSAEVLVRDELIKAIAQFLDQQFIDGAVAASAGVRPGSINNTSPNIASTGATVAAITTDTMAALLALAAANIQLMRPVWIMSPLAASIIGSVRTAQDFPGFPGMGAGNAMAAQLSLHGIPVIVSGNVPIALGKSSITLLEQSELMIADDGQTMIDTSTEASVQMDSAPATPPTPLVSFWQQNLVGIKAERFIYWLMRRTAAVQEITGFPGP